MTKLNLWRLLLSMTIGLLIPIIQSQAQDLVISEFMAINDNTLADQDGDFSDWIEIHNSGSSAVNLQGMHLTDDVVNLTKWTFPSLTLEADGYLVVFASDKDKTDASQNLHTNFKLSGSGEFLGLIAADGTTILSSFGDKYPVQTRDVSYGVFEGNFVSFTNPTPGVANSTSGNILDPIFSHKRGFYDAGFTLTLEDLNDNTDLYYTLDGNRPTAENSTLYDTPFTIDKTTVLSVIAIDPTAENQGNVVTQTYLFEDILDQPNDPEGYPSIWTPAESAAYPGDYEMDPEICTDENKPAIYEALKALPSVSLVLDIDDLFLDSEHDTLSGMYLNSIKHTDEWERPASMEYFDPTENVDFQVNCGMRIHGGNGRKPGNSPKHSLRVHFRGKYGPTKLNFNLFDENSATNEFNVLVLRAGYNYSWLKNSPEQCENTDYVRDPFAKATQLAMSRTAAHRKFAHVYLNGLYWGVYDISEKITNDFVESYHGGQEDDYDVVKDHNGVTDGTDEAWLALLSLVEDGFETNEKYFKAQGKNEDGTTNAEYQNLLDVRNLSDYILINFFMGNTDWDKNNWLAVRNRVTNEHGFKFLCWDVETSMNDLNEDMTEKNEQPNPTWIFNKLMENEEYRLYFADRVQKHFFGTGALTPGETLPRYMKITNELSPGLIAESARWGDYRRDVEGGDSYELYTVENQWQTRVDFVQNTYLPQRTDIVFDQLKNAGLYPAVDAPVFSSEGGDFNELVDLSISNTSGTVYYTLDDSDPREIGGSVAQGRAKEYSEPVKLFEDVVVKARVKDGENWSAIVRAKFKIEGVEATLVSGEICEGEEFLGFTENGTHYILEESSTGADSLVEIHLFVHPKPAVDLGDDQSVVVDSEVTLTSNLDFAEYMWSTSETSKSITITESLVGTHDYWLEVTDVNGCVNSDTVTISFEQPMNIDLTESGGLLVHPNPTSGQLNIELPESLGSSPVRIELFTISGMKVYSKELNDAMRAESIDLKHIPKGLYLLKIESVSFHRSVKVVKE